MIGSMIGTVANIVLDPFMISILHMGAARCRHRDNDRKHPGKRLLPLVLHEKEPELFDPAEIFQP